MLRHHSTRLSFRCGMVMLLIAASGGSSYGQEQPPWMRNYTSPKPPVRVAGKQANSQTARPQTPVAMPSQPTTKQPSNPRPANARIASRPNGQGEVAFMTSESAARNAVRPTSNFVEYEEVNAPYPTSMREDGSSPCGCANGGCNCGGCDLGAPYDIGCGCEPCGHPCCGDACGMGCGCGDGCVQSSCMGGCRERGCVPLCLYVPPITDATIFAGVQGFKGPLDWNRDRGNFGFHEGFNLGGKMCWLPIDGLGFQAGYQAMQNQLSGDGQANTSESHHQHFLTAGLFRRACAGLQGGLVYDWMRDERVQAADFSQIRGEVGIVNPRGHEIGFTFGVHIDDSQLLNQRSYQSTDWYLVYYRMKCDCSGEVRAFAGFDDGDRGVVGTDFLVALNPRWSLQGGFTYYIPSEDNQGEGAEQEGWNIGLNLVWNYGCRAKSSINSPYRPLFNVADNGTMFIDDRP